MLPATEDIITRIRGVIKFKTAHLHEPYFDSEDEQFVLDAVRCGFVSSEGPHLTQFEQSLSDYTKAEHVVAVTNGTIALQLSIMSLGIKPGSEILVPSLTFIGTGNAILHADCTPHFVDVESHSYGIDYDKLLKYLEKNSEIKNGETINKKTGRQIAAIMPVHIFGAIGDIEKLSEIAKVYKLRIIEDAAEALGSWKNHTHAGLFGDCGIISFNGNKIITTGGGGALITNSKEIAERARHLSRTSKIAHKFEYFHDSLGYNFRLPALNAALGLAQMQRLEKYLVSKKMLMNAYLRSFNNSRFCDFLKPRLESASNNWLNAVKLKPKFVSSRNAILEELHENGLYCRPIWNLMSKMPHMKNFPSMNLDNSEEIEKSTINIPSSSFLLSHESNKNIVNSCIEHTRKSNFRSK